MDIKRVKMLMVPLDDYAIVSENTILVDALNRMVEASKSTIVAYGHQVRAVLVKDYNGDVVGYLGHMDFLRAIEPKYNLISDFDVLSRSEIDTEILDSMSELLGYWEGNLENLCTRAATIEVKHLMRPISESINEDAPITEAIHKMIKWQVMRILVTNQARKVVGIIRLADLFNEVAERMKTSDRGSKNNE
ncbi:MAG: CBS domain-containing protein [Candidatus Electryonea clarkiae]|nr:CBS domain-containing protein [Candidatus Electryonea clarkiae]MDP8287043.1 CBS domain-containing protein [Candidatus Electryonea clarkiae]